MTDGDLRQREIIGRINGASLNTKHLTESRLLNQSPVLFFILLLSLGFAATCMAAEAGKMLGMTAAHNAVRAKEGLPKLKWVDGIAAYAQQWADYLAHHNRCELKHRPANAYGENLYWASAVQWSDGRQVMQELTASQIVAHWAAEKQHYDYGSNSCSAAMCGHYTQIVWRDTQRLGCGMAVCANQAQIWVCNYDPPGNYVGKRPW